MCFSMVLVDFPAVAGNDAGAAGKEAKAKGGARNGKKRQLQGSGGAGALVGRAGRV